MTARTTQPGTRSARGRIPSAGPASERLIKGVATPHFWLLVAMFLLAGLLHYFEPIVVRINPNIPWALDEYSMDRALFLLPVTYAGFVFGSAGGMAALFLAAAIMAPSCVNSDDQRAAFTQTGAVVLVGALVVSWFQAQVAEKERGRQTLSALQRTQKELRAHIDALRSEEKALEALNAVYFLCSQSLDLDEILRGSPEKIMGVMGADIALVFLLDEGGREMELVAHRGVSDAFVAEVGRLRLGKSLGDFVATLDQPLVEPSVSEDPRLPQAAIAREGIESGVLVPVRARGRVFGTLCAGTRAHRRFSDEEVQLLGACGNAIGIALENARLYQRVRASEKGYRDLFENANDAIFAHDLGGRIFAANEACTRLTGYTRGELLGMEAPLLFPAEDREKVQALERRLAAGGPKGEDRLELRLIKKDATEVTVDLASTLIAGDDRPPGVQHIARDVTEQRRAQESLRYYVRQITSAQEEERLRISRDLHDETAQSLLLVSQRLDALISEAHWKLREQAKQQIADVRQLTLQTLSGLRRVSEALRPRILDDLGLVPAVGLVADELAGQGGTEVNLEVRGAQRDLPREQQVLLFRIAQEALSNVRRHAQASRVDVTIEFGEGTISLSVRDNGQGFVMPSHASDLAATGKLGILGMIERARLLGGQLSIRSEPGGGTIVTVDVPG